MMACSAEILYILLNISGRECQDPILIKVNCTFLEPLTSVMYIFHYIFKHTKTHFIGIYTIINLISEANSIHCIHKRDSFKFPCTSLLVFYVLFFIIFFILIFTGIFLLNRNMKSFCSVYILLLIMFVSLHYVRLDKTNLKVQGMIKNQESIRK